MNYLSSIANWYEGKKTQTQILVQFDPVETNK